jgi:hypothetical protein
MIGKLVIIVKVLIEWLDIAKNATRDKQLVIHIGNGLILRIGSD